MHEGDTELKREIDSPAIVGDFTNRWITVADP